ncbi:Repeat domain-containing protein [Cognatiyoonia sediminum]|uniref:Repeat domain-containing protein n=1 Tax=Cognatiyoonia sediminum TaxID=1508389 RepID=A0A1M5S1N4_9RHOB|nr:CRTAC1 family protein [Cognatiyoonia sediminum]SHH32542.1 Repeat domain-containing protein [Cognatiyoonia sediminum]
MYRLALAFFVASPVNAQVAFEDFSDRLIAHEYNGGWEHFVGGGIAVFDCNADGLPDVFAAGGENPASLFVNQGEFEFERRDGLEELGTVGAYPLRLDADDPVDLFVLRVGQNIILKGRGDCEFEDATNDFSIPANDRWSTAFSAWWEDGAELPTLAIGNYVDRSDPDGPFEACDENTLLRPNGGSYSRTALTPGFCPLSILAANDARGRPTLRISNDRHYYVTGGYEQMWDIEDQRFLDEADGWQNVSLWGMGIASRDLTGDGRDEVMLTSMGDQLMQLANDDGTYRAAPYGIGTYAQRPHVGGDGRPSTGWHAEFGDVDNDGLADLFIAKGNVDQMPGMATRDPNNLLQQQADGSFVEISDQAGVATLERSRGGALVDFDNDGQLDLIVSNRRAPLELYRNVTEGTGNWIKVSLEQAGPNRDAIGARIIVESDGRTQSQQHVIGGGHAGGQLGPRHFGIGPSDLARVTVMWPDGTKTSLDVGANEVTKIQKP